LPQSFGTEEADVRVGPDHDAKIAIETMDLADRVRPVIIEVELLRVSGCWFLVSGCSLKEPTTLTEGRKKLGLPILAQLALFMRKKRSPRNSRNTRKRCKYLVDKE
jgi:hypothetical protein